MRFKVSVAGHHNIGGEPAEVEALDERDAARLALEQWGLRPEYLRPEGLGSFRYACGWQYIEAILVEKIGK